MGSKQSVTRLVLLSSAGVSENYSDNIFIKKNEEKNNS